MDVRYKKGMGKIRCSIEIIGLHKNVLNCDLEAPPEVGTFINYEPKSNYFSPNLSDS